MGVGVAQGLIIGSSLLSAGSQFRAGKAEESASRFNAEQIEFQASQTRESARIQESQQREADARFLSTVRANIGASGVLANPGTSALEVMADTAAQAEKDALLIRRGGILDEADLRTQGVITRSEGRLRRRASETAAFTTLLSGAASATKLGGTKKRARTK